jgi:hypothetical protein
MKHLVVAIVLGIAASCSTYAGDIPISGSPTPQRAEGAQVISTVPGDIPSVPAADQASDAAFSALLTVLGIFAV